MCVLKIYSDWPQVIPYDVLCDFILTPSYIQVVSVHDLASH